MFASQLHDRVSPTFKVVSPSGKQHVRVLSPQDYQPARKSVTYGEFIEDYLNDSGPGTQTYDANLLENAYRTSVYVFSALRKVANLLSTVPVGVEVKRGNNWVRAPEDHGLARMIDRDMPQFFYRGYFDYAIYGQTMAYKRQTMRGIALSRNGSHDPFTITNGGVSGFHVIPYREYQLDLDYVYGEVTGFNLTTTKKYGIDRTHLKRNECIYLSDFDPRDPNRGTSIVSLIIHAAITNAKVAEFAAHYFTTGAMPLVIVTTEGGETRTETDLDKIRNRIERAWRGLYNSMRAVFFNRPIKVDTVGIEADRVNADGLNRESLNAIAAGVGLAPDLIVPSESGSDNARHKYLIKEAWTDTILPLAGHMLEKVSIDLGLPREMRLFIDMDKIPALDADRSDVSSTEISIAQSGLQSWNEARERMGMPVYPEMNRVLYLDGKWQSLDKWIKEDSLLNQELLTAVLQGWNDNAFTRRQLHEMLGVPLPEGAPDGYKFEIVQEAAGGAGGFGGGDTFGGVEISNPNLGGGGSGTPVLPSEVFSQQQKQIEAATGLPARPGTPAPAHSNIIQIPTSATSDKSAPAELKADAKKASSFGEPAAYILLTLPYNNVIRYTQERLALPDVDGVRLTRPSDYHVTLAAIPVLSDDQQSHLAELMGAIASRWRDKITLHLNGIGYFNNDEKDPIFINVEVSEELLALRQECLDALTEAGIAYSDKYPEFIAHITLAYVKDTAMLPPSEDWPIVRADVKPEDIVISRESFRFVSAFPMRLTIEPDGTNQVTGQIERAETLLNDIGGSRRSMIAAVQSGKGIPKPIADAMKSISAPSGIIKEAAIAAIKEGWFDADAVPKFNPVMRHMVKDQTDPMGELDAWERSALRNFAKAQTSFEVYLIPPSIEGKIKAALSEVTDPKNKNAIRDVFAKARTWIQVKPVGEDDIDAVLADLDDDAALASLLDIEDEESGEEES